MEFWSLIAEPRSLATLLGAAISALVAISIWVINKRYEQAQQKSAARRRQADLMRALVAEMRAFLKSSDLKETDIDTSIKDARELFGKGGHLHEEVPFVSIEKHDRIFDAAIENVQILPTKPSNPSSSITIK